ncbi:hypothetical protein M408DRAFT_220255 [Serendipita vermifera MAFF 305830]|uniref:poly(ADP-ribose) glycohydrolase n=1 Tax=Serendipita vermifera MAFF 305830 TaxID=933852 RepID=A0A0C2X2N1_SERVB|nr:hypothetical protein M408DRAFT_220255 [Serendipita vermifera MAFF 305830]
MIKLPSHVESRIADPLSILDSDEALVPYWDFLTALLEPIILDNQSSDAQDRVNKFTDAVETIYYSLTGRGSQDLSLLLESVSTNQLAQLIDPMIRASLDMKELFPDGSLGSLQVLPEPQSPETFLSKVTLSDSQLTCLICHMFLGTFPKPPWMTWDGPNLKTWFADDGKGDRNIKIAYIRVLISYLEASLLSKPTPCPGENVSGVSSVEFSLFDAKYSYQGDGSTSLDPEASLHVWMASASLPLIPLEIFLLEEEDDNHETCFSSRPNDVPNQQREEICQLVSANKDIGFGPAGTQEERVFGACPALLPAVLLTQTLSATQSLLISGDTEIYGHFTGHLRSARLRQLYSPSERILQGRTGRSYLFIDALEMDEDKHGKDAEAANILREMHKLMSGFSALALRSKANGHRSIVVVPPWGCGTFGGDFRVKLLLIWMAATVCGIGELRCAVKEGWWVGLDPSWRLLIDRIRGKERDSGAWDVKRVWKLVFSLEAGVHTRESVDWLNR